MSTPLQPELLARLEAAVMARDGRKKGKEIRFICPAHDDHNASADYNVDKDAWCCRVCGEGGGAVDLARRLGLEVPSRPERRRNDKARRNGHERHELRDPSDGHLIAVHLFERDGKGDKRVWWRQPDGKLGLGGIKTADLPLFGAHMLPDLADGADVLLVEGETPCKTLLERGVAAVATVCGAGVTPSDASLQVLSRFNVTLWPDADDAGREHMARIAARFHALAIPCRIVDWQDAPDKGGDAADFDGDADALQVLLDAARLYEPEPIPDGAVLLDDIVQIVVSYVVLPKAAAAAVALYVVLTHIIDVLDCVPYLHVTSPEKRSGKTRLLEVLELLVARPWLAGRVSAAVLIRRLERDGPTLLLDEADGVFKMETEYSEALRTVLNAGHRRGVTAWLCVGKGFDLNEFHLFGPKVIAGIGNLPDTVADRSIRIELQRRAPNEPISRFRRREADALTKPIRQRLEQWAAAHRDNLRDARPSIPPALDDRAADGWEGLLAVADAVGGDWPQRARLAALTLSSGDVRDNESLRVKLLADIRVVFGECGADRLPSADLVTHLNSIEESPWGEYEGKPLNPRRLGWLLKPFGVKPVHVSDSTSRYYLQQSFDEPWTRYCIPPEKLEELERLELAPDSDSARIPVLPVLPVSTGTEENMHKHPSPLVQAALEMGATPVDDADDLPFDDIDALDNAEIHCHVCGGVEFYYRADGTGPVCARCHPRPPEEVPV